MSEDEYTLVCCDNHSASALLLDTTAGEVLFRIDHGDGKSVSISYTQARQYLYDFHLQGDSYEYAKKFLDDL